MAAQSLLYVNARSRRGRDGKRSAIAALRRAGIAVVDVSNATPRELPRLARRGEGIERIIIGGGDGTINGLLEALVEMQRPVGILPLGTANDFAATLGIGANIGEACRIIADGHTRYIDLGWVNGKHYVNEGSLGISTRIARGLTTQAKRRWGVFALAVRTARVLAHPQRFRVQIRANGKSHMVLTYQITIGNGRRFGGLLRSLDAQVADHKLELYSLEAEKFHDIIRLLPLVAAGQFERAPKIRFQRGREFRIRTDRPRPIFTDGERTTQTPAHFKVVPSALAVYTPTTAGVS